jgi:hypothetical protein
MRHECTWGSPQTCGSATLSQVLGRLNVGFQPRGTDGSRLQRRSAIRQFCGKLKMKTVLQLGLSQAAFQ